MSRFTIKFIVAALLVLMPACYFHFCVVDNLSGDIGRLGMIPFGEQYDGLEVSSYERNTSVQGDVIDVYDKDSVQFYPIITVGDSFSQFGDQGYQYELSSELSTPVANFKVPDSMELVDCYMALMNDGCLKAGQTVVLECVERSFVKRLAKVDTLSRFSTEDMPLLNSEEVKSSIPFLNRYLSWIRLEMNYRNPIASFPLSKNCFTHPKYSSTLHVYHSYKLREGDLSWPGLSESVFDKARQNMQEIIKISEREGIRLIIMIATDKYDAYEPWISCEHQKNPTLDEMPEDPRIFDPRSIIRVAIESDMMDVYKLNNTHWSVAGADMIGRSLADRIKTLGYL